MSDYKNDPVFRMLSSVDQVLDKINPSTKSCEDDSNEEDIPDETLASEVTPVSEEVTPVTDAVDVIEESSVVRTLIDNDANQCT